MQEKSADCSKNRTFLVESRKSKVESEERRAGDGESGIRCRDNGRRERRIIFACKRRKKGVRIKSGRKGRSEWQGCATHV